MYFPLFPGWVSTVAPPWGWWLATTSPTTASCPTPATWQGEDLGWVFCHSLSQGDGEDGGRHEDPHQLHLQGAARHGSHSPSPWPTPQKILSMQYFRTVFIFPKVGGFRCDYRGALDLGVTYTCILLTSPLLTYNQKMIASLQGKPRPDGNVLVDWAVLWDWVHLGSRSSEDILGPGPYLGNVIFLGFWSLG